MPEHKQGELDISHPGQGKHIISPSEAIKRNPDFFLNRPEWANWTLRVRHLDGTIEDMPPGTDWEAISRFGSFRSAVITDNEGNPSFDKPRADEAPNVNIVAYGRDKKTGELKIAMISQARPHADNDFEPEDTEDMVFEQIPMGFLDKVIGKDQIERLESAEEGARRETTEETGATAVKDISYPEYPKHYPNPTFVGTNSNLAFVEVDLEQIDKMKMDRSEPIFKAEYIPVSDLVDDIKQGKTERGYARMCTSNSAILIFLSNLNSFRNAERNERILSKQGKMRKEFKKRAPRGYAEHMLREAEVRNPENSHEYRIRVDRYKKHLNKEALDQFLNERNPKDRP